MIKGLRGYVIPSCLFVFVDFLFGPMEKRDEVKTKINKDVFEFVCKSRVSTSFFLVTSDVIREGKK